ncbi:UDP-N-acetylmuramoyl-L-alanyl-D-glutamate--2,6-diaminopimelate ligase [Temperatibacter marinus]|uniref:UDP-N-acetylmuramoyl-L-alanyl-D-glutamate--2,6-diaminopimelate ligase n=1 Tax=Temperatibacter marinus TaxID=1456591 RepID=A0AA52EFX4_9PROT|nr:UDP-N-acetylmuramoyl-L-alanyl-D-glutamate--2,6-diaminopimelate ligase [Temperatibacter marinus]WND01589.1 UDP-N-acetylmuramoyl-L-alanyl-D-glutamate--2,6-diaminopimelate ligase [Temperatibacter marinus]
MTRLSDLLSITAPLKDCSVRGVTADSRQVKADFMFFALPGVSFDGRDFIPQAIAAGASTILTTRGAKLPEGCPVQLIESDDPRADYARVAARYYSPVPDFLVAVTGTNGKTSVADFTRQIWKRHGLISGSLGTLGVRSDLIQTQGGLTTPDPMLLHQSLKQLAVSGVTHCALEASSHGLDQRRLEGVHIQAAAFTNLTRDHLDYHANEMAYFKAKERLFTEVMTEEATAVINIDSPHGQSLAEKMKNDGRALLTLGYAEGSDAQILAVTPHASGLVARIKYQAHEEDYRIPLMGSFQAENALAAALLASTADIGVRQCLKSMESLRGVCGRMQYIGETAKGGAVYVDFAHTPDGLKTVLEAASKHATNSLDVLFGCGGDRDAGKRPIMGEIAGKLANRIYVTDDNPRHEDAAAIRKQVMKGCGKAQEISDRGEAIHQAVEALNDGDILILAGKGHEEGQIIGDEKIAFSDIHTAKELLAVKELQ